VDDALTAYETTVERSVQAQADVVVTLECGWAVHTLDLPLVWTLNQLCVTRPVAPEALAGLADEVQSSQPFRHVVVRHAPTADDFEPVAVALGWRVERDVVMALDQAALDDARPPRDVAVVGLSEDQMVGLMGEWLLEERGETSSEGLGQVLEWNRRETRYFGERVLGVLGADGTPLAVTKLRRDGSFAWVEDVYTTPSARGNGYARALVTRAVRLATDAGCSPVVIVADADDWPQHLYASVGFRPVGGARLFHRDPPPAD
jgi:GNAT superfamily N-acetyltransferase